jgi:ATP-binding cassette, subfamily C (CFTR/MRP), member 1
VIALGSTGKIVEQGTFESILAADGYVRSLQANELIQDNADNIDTDPTTKVKSEAALNKQLTSDNLLKTNDRSVYAHYIKAAGKVNAVIFLAGGIAFAVLFVFPRESPSAPFYPP